MQPTIDNLTVDNLVTKGTPTQLRVALLKLAGAYAAVEPRRVMKPGNDIVRLDFQGAK